MLKVLSTIDGLGRLLDPDFNITEKTQPFISRIQRERLNPHRIYDELSDFSDNFFRLMQVLPGELRKILQQVRQGSAKMEFKHHGLEPMFTTLDRVSNRIAFAIVLASLVIGSSLIVLSGIPPIWRGIPVIGLAGFVIAAIMGFWLLWSILKRGKI